ENERTWTESALSAQKLLVARLRVQGVVAQPEYSYTRTINGFSAAFDARGIAVLERAAAARRPRRTPPRAGRRSAARVQLPAHDQRLVRRVRCARDRSARARA